jgi:DNA-binding MarR family transcriptional regulator
VCARTPSRRPVTGRLPYFHGGASRPISLLVAKMVWTLREQVVMSTPESNPVEPTPAQRDVVLERFATLGRQLSQATVLYHEQIAGHVGLSATDHKCLDLAVQADHPLTAGQIAELSGLSTGAVTGVIDRLERAGFVRRVRDPHDRRKVLVEVSRGSLARYGNAYDGLWSALDASLTGYTEDELKAVERFVLAMVRSLRDEAEKLAAMRGATR